MYDWGSKHPVLSVLFLVAIATWLLLLPFFLLGCATPNTYVLPAQSAKTDADFERVITLRLPFENQPTGAAIACESKDYRIFAIKIDDYRVHVREHDGEERDLEMPGDGSPRGLVTVWPDGGATKCGLANLTPVGTEAYVMWREFTLFMKRTGIAQARYRIAGDVLDLHFPLTPEDRTLLRKRSVPSEIADLLY
ncbi:hypothetical protein HZC53_01960 [Candidatus Uhrbacteria bacterium]|nr:hypothetical protein [Candidatus Uhrbacteria bacterium]